MALALLSISAGSNASASMPWHSLSDITTSIENIAEGNLLETGPGLSTFFDDTANISVVGTINNFILDEDKSISGAFTNALGTYSISGTIKSFEHNLFNQIVAFSAFNADGDILSGNLSYFGGSGSLTLSGDSFTFVEASPVPLPPAVLLFGGALFCLVGFQRR